MFDYRFGKPLTVTDLDNQLSQSIVYNAFGEPVSSTGADNSVTENVRYLCGDEVPVGLTCPTSAAYLEAVQITHASSTKLGAPLAVKYYDKVHRVVREQSFDVNGDAVKVDTEYYADGRLRRVSNPYTGSAATD